MPNTICILCNEVAELQNSHIIPAFVFRWMKESSGTGHIRQGTKPNKRIQDGIKRYWMCSKCEGLLSKSETQFSNNIFYPYIANSGSRIRYSTWLMHFCTSLSWRVLRFYRDEVGLDDWDKKEILLVDKAEIIWRELLLKQRQNPGQCEQHLLPLDEISSSTMSMAPNINRYLMRMTDMDICRGGETIFTYVKLGRFIIVGFINEPHPRHWKGTKVNANSGIIEPKEYVLPKPFGEYINEKAERSREILNSISDKQHEKISQSFEENIDQFIGSDMHKAMAADVAMFGNNAFVNRKNSNKDK